MIQSAQSANLSAVALGMVKNEADIIEAFVRHNLHFVDLIVLLDNASTDGTREILEALQREGLPLLIIDDPIFGYFQAEKMTELYRRVVPVFQPEVVFVLDADEFIGATDRAGVNELLKQVPVGAQALIPWTTHTPDPDRTTADLLSDPLASAPRRRTKEDPVYYKAIIRRCPSMDKDLVIDQGNHSVSRASGDSVVTLVISGLRLVHLPVRSIEQITAKAVNGWLAYLVRNQHTKGIQQGSQWQLLFDRITRGSPLKPEDLVRLSLDYAQKECQGRSLHTHTTHDPCPALYGPLRYLELGHHDPLAKVALSLAEHLSSGEGQKVSDFEYANSALDVAAIRCVMRSLGLTSYVTLDPEWYRAMDKLWPECAFRDMLSADALVIPNVIQSDLYGLVVPFNARPERRILAWLPADHTPTQLANALKEFNEMGWQPEPLSTLSLRAVSAYGFIRRGGLVMRPEIAGHEGRSNAMVDALLAMAALPLEWADPEPEWISYPLQSLHLEVSKTTGPTNSEVQNFTPGKLADLEVKYAGANNSVKREIQTSVIFGATRPEFRRRGGQD